MNAEVAIAPCPAEYTASDERYVFPASFAQSRLWFLHQLDPDSAAYSMIAPFRVTGPLDIGVLERTLNAIVIRHESLRTTFAPADGDPVQLILPEMDLPLPVVDIADDDAATAWLAAEAARPFDLTRGPLIRANVLRLGPETHILSVSMHHIVSDGWSLGVLMREASVLYAHFLSGGGEDDLPLPAIDIQYADYSLWQRERLTGDVLTRQIDYWRDALAGVPTVLELPVDRSRPARRTERGAQYRVRLSPALGQRLNAFARQQGATPYMVLLAGFQALLGCYTGQRQLLVGSPAAGRTRHETEPLIGFFVNTLVLRGDLRGHPGFASLVARVKDTVLDAFAHQDVPFERLVEALAPERDPSRPSLFQAMFVLQNTPMAALELGRAVLEPIVLDAGTAKFEITLALEECEDGGLSGYWEYNADLFDATTIAQLATHYTRLLESALDDPVRPVAWLDLFDPAERAALAAPPTAVPYPSLPLHRLFAQQARARPDEPAVATPGETLSYAALDARANRLARLLIEHGAGPETRVAMLLEPTAAMIVCLLAILKSGAAYVPIDPGFPAERIAYILQQSRSVAVLIDDSRQMPVSAGCVALAIGAAEAAARDRPSDDCEGGADTRNAAYVIYTSGSTGRPKGVVVEHRQVLSYSHAIRNRFALDANAHYALLQPLAVDSCNTVLMPWLCFGGVLHVLPRMSALDPVAIARYFGDRRMDVLKIAPSHLAALLDASAAGELLPGTELVLGGEASRWDWIRDIVLPRLAPGCRVDIHYGPTETTVGVLTHRVDPQDSSSAAIVPLGLPLGNVGCHIVDADLQPAAKGVVGEILIGGDTVSRGYLDAPGLTAERFVPDPFAAHPGARAYRTGDRGRRLLDGGIAFLGRFDSQVKIRGFRVDPGEVEAVLREHPAVGDAIVVGRDDGRGAKNLIAYVVAELGVHDDNLATTLRDWLATRLPDHMLPSAVVRLVAFPRAAQGKVDLSALPTPDAGSPTVRKARPMTAMEARLSRLWEEMLDARDIDRDASFFALGGHSLLMIRMLAHVRKRLGHAIAPADFLTRPTIAHLAALATGVARAATGLLVPLQSGGVGIPFVCVHPIGGDITGYARLVAALGDDRPISAIRAPEEPTPDTIEAIATRYLDVIAHAVPQGRYAIGGWSFGGLVALEMARQAERRGGQPSRLILIDTHPPRLEPAPSQSDLIERFAADVVGTMRLKDDGQVAAFRARDPDAQRDMLIETMLRGGALDADDPGAGFDRAFAMFARHARAAAQYRRRTIAQPIDLFAASEGTGEAKLSQAWSGWTSRGVRGHSVSGDHHGMMRSPSVDDLAAQLRRCLSDADGEAAS